MNAHQEASAPRPALPVAVWPLDDFGLLVSSSLMEEVGRAEPDLLKTGWLRVLGADEPPSPADAVDALEELLAQCYRATTRYTPVTPAYQTAIVFMVGQAGAAAAGGALLSALDVLKEYRHGDLAEHLVVIPFLEVGRYQGEVDTDQLCLLRSLHDAIAAKGLRLHVLLADNYGAAGVRCGQRVELAEGVRLYLEAFVMGHHWDGYAYAWYRAPEGPAGVTYASMAVKGVRSPTVEVCEYLVHVGFYRAVDSLFLQDETRSLPLERPAPLSFSPDEVGHAPRPPMVRARALFMKPKVRIQEGLDRARNTFVQGAISWRDRLVSLLPEAQGALVPAAQRNLQAFEERLRAIANDSAASPRSLARLRSLVDTLDASRPSLASHDALLAKERPLAHENPARAMGPLFDQAHQLAAKLPNSPSLVTHLVVAAVLQWGITLGFARLWTDAPWWTPFALAAGVAIWLVGFLYLAWRIPSWSIEQFFTKRVSGAANGLLARTREGFGRLTASLARHWDARTEHSACSRSLRLAHRIRVTCAYLEKRANAEREAFPRDELATRLTAPGTVFATIVGNEAHLEDCAKQLEKPGEYLAGLAARLPEFRESLLAGEAISAEGILRDAISRYYRSVAAPLVQAERAGLVRVLDAWRRADRQPLIRLGEAGLHAPTVEWCVAGGDWVETLAELAAETVDQITHVPIQAADHLYLVATYPKIALPPAQ